MGLAIAALIVFVVLDAVIMLGISRVSQLDSFTLAECITIPLALFLLSASVLRAAGYATVPWPILAACYTCTAIAVFSLIAIRKNGIHRWSQIVTRSLLTALLFSAMHLSLSALVGLLIGA